MQDTRSFTSPGQSQGNHSNGISQSPPHGGVGAPAPLQQPQAHNAPMRPPTPAGLGRAVTAPVTHAPSDIELEPISLVEDELEPPVPAMRAGAAATSIPSQPQQQPPPPAPKKIVAIGGSEQAARKHDWKRKCVTTGTGACRVKSFHGKYSEQGLEYLDNAINEWLDNHAEVEVKFVTSTVMTFEGKIREPALVLNVWY